MFIFKRAKSLGEDFRPVSYSDPEESWFRSGLYIGAIFLFAAATIGVFVYKFSNPATVSVNEIGPSVDRIKELLAKQDNHEISQLSCPCTKQQTVADLGVESKLDWNYLRESCRLEFNGTAGHGANNRWSALCSGMENNIGSRAWYTKTIPTFGVLNEKDFNKVLDSLYAQASSEGLWTTRWVLVNTIWIAFLQVGLEVTVPNSCGYGTTCSDAYGSINTDSFYSADGLTTFFSEINTVWDNYNFWELEDSFPVVPRAEFYQTFLDGCKASGCTWLQDQESLDIALDCIALLGTVWSILLFVAGFVYGAGHERFHQKSSGSNIQLSSQH